MLALGTTMKATTRSWGRTGVVTSMTMATDSAACMRRIACSLEELSAELLQAEESLTPANLSKFSCKIWTSENMPEDWKTGLIVKLAKKGGLSNCNNWRSMPLLSLTSKVFSKVIY